MKINVIVTCVVVLSVIAMSGPVHGLERVSITETWQTANPEGEIIFEKYDGEITAVSDLGTGFRWGGWTEVNTKGKYPETHLDWDAKAGRDGILSDFTDGKFDADGYEGGTHIYTIFSSTGTNVPDMNVPNLETVTVINTKNNDWTAKLTIRDANGDWYLSSLIELPGQDEQTISVAALTWQKITGDTAADMNELDAGGPHAEQLGGSGDGDGPGPLTADVTDPNSTSPDLSAITGAGFVQAGPAPGPKIWFGPVTWQGFKTPPTAYHAFPVDVVLDSPWASLRWKTGGGVTGETVYFGEDPNNLTDVTADVADNTYALSSLELGKTYYWRVDSTQADGTVLPPDEGTWSFSVADHAVIESFEDFSDKYGNAIFEHWLDGWGFVEPAPGFPGNGTGSTVGYITAPYAEQEIVHGGGVSMPFGYDNSGQSDKKLYSETERTLDAVQDWSGAGGKALTLYVYGDTSATAVATDKVYAVLEDSAGNAGAVQSDVDVMLEEWQEINIDLQDYIAAGVDLTSIAKIYLGIGDRVNPQTGGTGKLYFDDVRVYVSRCIPEKCNLVADLNNDCMVDQSDMDLLMAEYGLSQGDSIPLTAGPLITGEVDAQNNVAFTEGWDGHSDERYAAFYSIADDGGQPVLELSHHEDGYYKHPEVKTAENNDFPGTTTVTIEWRAKEKTALALFGVANNGQDPEYIFQFVLYDNGAQQNLGWVPNDDVDADPSDAYPFFDPGPTYLLNCYGYEDLLTGMAFDVYVTLDLVVVVDEAGICTVDYIVTQSGVTIGSGTLSPAPLTGATNKRNWSVRSAFGQEEGEYLVGGFIKSCDITYQKVLSVDLNADGTIDDLDVAIIEQEMGRQNLWP